MSADRSAADLEPGLTVKAGGRAGREISLGKKYVVFCGITSPRRASCEHVLDARGREQERRRGLAASTAATALLGAGCVADALAAEAVDELDVELALRAVRRSSRPSRYGARPRRRLVAEPGDRASSARSPFSASRCAKSRCVGKIVEPRSCGRDEHDHASARSPGPVLPRRRAPSRSGGGRRRSGAACRRSSGERRSSSRQSRSPSTSQSGSRSGGATGRRRRGAGRSARAARASPAAGGGAPPSGRAWVRSCGSTPPVSYGSAASETTSPSRVPGDAVGPTYVLRRAPRPPAARLDEDAAPRASRRSARAGLLRGVGQRQVDDVVRAPREQLRARSSGRSRRTAARRDRRADPRASVVAERRGRA